MRGQPYCWHALIFFCIRASPIELCTCRSFNPLSVFIKMFERCRKVSNISRV